MIRALSLALLALLAQQVTIQDLDRILEKADKLLEEAKAGHDGARSAGSVAAFVEAGFKLEEARIKYIVLQEIGPADKQKIASDRLRAVNQLNKLINEGRLAVSAPPAARPDVSSPVEAPKPVKPAVNVAVDVTKRPAIPDGPKLRDAEKLVKDLFKDQFAKKAPADRQVLARALLDQARKGQDEPAVLWVLCREAQDAAAQACEFRIATEAIDTAALAFDVDAVQLRSMMLTAAGKSAKTPVEFALLADLLLKLAEEFVSVDQYDSAETAATAAMTHARRSTNPTLVLRATNRSREVAEAKSRFQGLKGMLETLARTSDDPAANNEMGQFLCFVKGNWDLGLRFLAKGSDPVLKELAGKELALSMQNADQVALADAWWDLYEREKSPLRKSEIGSHLRTLYEGAVPGAAGLVKTKIEQRLEGLSAKISGVDLLAMINPGVDAVQGMYFCNGSVLTIQNGEWDRLQIPYAPPEEYDLSVIAERKEGIHNFNVGLVIGGRQFILMMDGTQSGDVSGLDLLDNKPFYGNETTIKGKLFPPGKKVLLFCSVRKNSVKVTVDGRKVVDWKGAPSRLSLFQNWKLPLSNSMMIGGWLSKFEVTEMILTPVSGQGKRLR